MRLQYDLSEISDTMGLPPGKYRAKLKAVTHGPSSTGQPMLTWVWEVVKGPFAGDEVKSWTSLQKSALIGLKQHLVGLGMAPDAKVDANTDKLVGKTADLIIAVRKGTSRDGAPANFSNVIGFDEPVKQSRRARDEDEDEDEDERPKKRSAKRRNDDEDEDDDPVTARAKASRRRDDEDDEDEEDERPKRKSVAKSSVKKRDEEEEEEDEEEDEKPARRRASSSARKSSRSKRDEDDDDDLPF